MPLYSGLSLDTNYTMHWANIYILGDNIKVYHIAQSDSVLEAAKILTRNLMRLIQW